MIAPVAIAGILIMAILANQAYASSKSESSSSEKCKTTENGNSQGEENCKTAQGENTEGGKEVKESSNTGKEVKESSNNGNAAQESSDNGKVAPVQPAITLTPIQAHVTTKSHMTATNEQLSENGVLPKLTLAPKPTGPTVAPRVEGAKTIAEVQEAKLRAEEQAAKFGLSSEEVNNEQQWFDTKTHTCEGGIIVSQLKNPRGIMPSNPNIDVTGKAFCKGKVISSSTGTNVLYGPNGKPIEKEQKISSSFLEWA